LEPYVAAIHQLPAAQEKLTVVTSGPLYQQTVHALQPLIAKRLALLYETLELRQNGPSDTAAEKILFARGKAAMDDIRRIMAGMKNEEEKLLKGREEAVRVEMRNSFSVLLFGNLLSFALLVLVFSLLFSENKSRKRAEIAIREQSREIEDLYDHAPCGYHSLDKNGTFVRVNATELAWLGYSRDEVVGKKKFSDVFMPESLETFRSKFAEFMERGSVHGLQFDLVRKDATTMPILLSAAAVKDASGNFEMTRTIVFDITERKHYQTEIERQNRELELRNREVQRANQLKSQFLASMSHELRTPLNAIIGFSTLLDEETAGPLNEKQKRFVHHVHAGAQHLLGLINDILDLSKIESGRMEFQREHFSVPGALPELLSTISPLAMAKRLTIEQESEAGLFVFADRVCFKQILYNLLSNAVKFTPANGTIRIQAARQADFVHVSLILSPWTSWHPAPPGYRRFSNSRPHPRQQAFR